MGALILDEFQNLSLAGTLGQRELIALLLNIREELGVPVVLVGTYQAASILSDNASTPRRLVEGGFYDLQPPQSAEDEDWRIFCEIVWKCQWVRQPLDTSDNIISVLYDISQGITAIMLNVLIASQIEAINSGVEKVDADLLLRVWRSGRFLPLHKIIDALRSKDPKLLSRYDDLYMNGFSQLKGDPLLGRVNVIKDTNDEGPGESPWDRPLNR